MLSPARGPDRGGRGLVPTERTSGLVLDHPSFEKIPLLLEIGHLAHPRKRIARAGKHRIHADLLATAVGDLSQVLLANQSVEPPPAPPHWGPPIAVLTPARFSYYG